MNDKYETEYTFKVLHTCDLCGIEPGAVSGATELDPNSYEMSFKWSAFTVKPIEVNGFTVTEENCKK